jgi:hypothetical protein
MRKFISVLVAALLLLGIVGTTAAQDTVTGYVVHGIPGLPVDVYVNGELFVADFQPDTIAGPIVGPANQTFSVAIVPAGGDPANPALATDASFPPGANVTVVAHLDESGAPTLSVFNNDFSDTSDARLIVRHTAAAPAVDALFFPGTANELRVGPLSNGQQTAADLPPGSYTAALVPTGTDIQVFGPLTANLEGGKAYVVYAIGSLADGSFKTLLQVIDLG